MERDRGYLENKVGYDIRCVDKHTQLLGGTLYHRDEDVRRP